MVKIGNFLFHYRNILFPLFYAALFIPSAVLVPTNLALIFGSLIIISGILVRSVTIGLVYIVRGGSKRKIHAENLVTDGIYQVCRNPMYLGNILLILGFGIFSNSILFVGLFFPLFCFIYAAIIKAEENFLIGKFGDEYVVYVNSTNALIPNLNRIPKAFSGRSLDFKRIIKKEYNSLFIYFSGILLLLLYHDLISLTTFVVWFITLLILYLAIKGLKKNKKL
jgi:protein-S-isoprenylcysteine O-methyltransferase Ste14